MSKTDKSFDAVAMMGSAVGRPLIGKPLGGPKRRYIRGCGERR